MKPIETIYRGYRFRSRLEARWAVFFDRVGIAWEYEPQGYEVGFSGGEWSKTRYLPDFWLPQTKTWAEVKGDVETINWQLLAEAVDWGCGLPDTTESWGTTRGLLLLGPIPEPSSYWPAHPILQHHKGGLLQWARLDCGTLRVEDYLSGGWAQGEQFDSSWGSQDREDWVKAAGAALRGQQTDWPCPPDIAAAYNAARQARFEHGESGEGHA